MCGGIAPATAGALSVQLENDSFDGASDAYYTHGLQLVFTPAAAVSWPKKFLPDSYETSELRTQYSLGQAIFTPYEIEKSQLQLDDRPYAGWLYLSASLQSKNLLSVHGLIVAERLDFSAGIVGPSSGAEQAQRGIHQLFDTYEVNGWSNQLKDEPAVLVSYARKWAHIRELRSSELAWEMSASLGGSVGNVATQLVSGFGLRLGKSLYSSAGASGVPPATMAPNSGVPSGSGDWFLFADWQLRFIEGDIFLDGNSTKDSHRVEKEPRVSEWRFGGAYSSGRYRWDLYHVRRSQEFIGQYVNASFSGISLTVSF